MRLPHLLFSAVVAAALPAIAADTWIVSDPSIKVRPDFLRMTVSSPMGFLHGGVRIAQRSADLAPCKVIAVYAPGTAAPFRTLDAQNGSTYKEMAMVCGMALLAGAKDDPVATMAIMASMADLAAFLEEKGRFAQVVIEAPDTQRFYLAPVAKASPEAPITWAPGLSTLSRGVEGPTDMEEGQGTSMPPRTGNPDRSRP